MNLSVSITKQKSSFRNATRKTFVVLSIKLVICLSDSVWPVKKETELRFYCRSSCLDYVNFNSGCMQNVRFSWQIIAFSSITHT